MFLIPVNLYIFFNFDHCIFFCSFLVPINLYCFHFCSYRIFCLFLVSINLCFSNFDFYKHEHMRTINEKKLKS